MNTQDNILFSKIILYKKKNWRNSNLKTNQIKLKIKPNQAKLRKSQIQLNSLFMKDYLFMRIKSNHIGRVTNFPVYERLSN